MSRPTRDDERQARFRALYDTNYEAILRYVLRRTPQPDALDVVSETFLVCWRRLGRVPGGDQARLWLYGTARRVLANHARAERRRARLTRRVREQATREEDIATAPDADAGVAAAFGRLRPGDRELLALTAWEGLDPHEVATVVGCSPGAARIRLHRARRRFAHELEQEDHAVLHQPFAVPTFGAEEGT
jgi:RNA polymerase sigma-70 factor (ECF subfamily)